MSLLRRVEQAQREQQERAAQAEPGPAQAEARTVSIVPTPASLRPVPSASREEYLRDIRQRVQGDVSGAFHSLLDVADPVALRARIEEIVDRNMTAGGQRR